MPPTLEELEECRLKLIEDIREGESSHGQAEEICLIKSGLKQIEELIKTYRAE